jgi:hypothetical protein
LPTDSAHHSPSIAGEIEATKADLSGHPIGGSIWNHDFEHSLKTQELTGAPEKFSGRTQLGMTCHHFFRCAAARIRQATVLLLLARNHIIFGFYVASIQAKPGA